MGISKTTGSCFASGTGLLGTYCVAVPRCNGLKERPHETVFDLLRYGFGWEAKPSEYSVNLESMIAEAAYYKAEKRNFYPGYELLDWLEAKSEVLTDLNNHT